MCFVRPKSNLFPLSALLHVSASTFLQLCKSISGWRLLCLADIFAFDSVPTASV